MPPPCPSSLPLHARPAGAARDKRLSHGRDDQEQPWGRARRALGGRPLLGHGRQAGSGAGCVRHASMCLAASALASAPTVAAHCRARCCPCCPSLPALQPRPASRQCSRRRRSAGTCRSPRRCAASPGTHTRLCRVRAAACCCQNCRCLASPLAGCSCLRPPTNCAMHPPFTLNLP